MAALRIAAMAEMMAAVDNAAAVTVNETAALAISLQRQPTDPAANQGADCSSLQRQLAAQHTWQHLMLT